MNSLLGFTTSFLVALLLVVQPHALPAQTQGWAWTQVVPSGAVPQNTGLKAMAYDSQRGKTVMVLAAVFSFRSETWEFDGVSWTMAAAPAPGSLTRYEHAMAFDSQRGRTVLYGGIQVSGGVLADTWEWDGATWTQVALTGLSPGSRQEHAMVYDSQRGKTVLFGGTNTSGFLADTWEWDGTTWQQMGLFGPAPGSRGRHSMAYDSHRGKTVMFGGRNAIGTLADTWEWDGGSWAQVPLTGSAPASRADHAMVYDSQRRKTVLFGGSGSVTNLNDTWEWNGTAWGEVRFNGPVPPGTAQHSMVYDSQRGKILMSGSAMWELTAPIGPNAEVSYRSISTSATPPAVSGHAIAPLPGGGALLFGGTFGTSPQPFTYELQNGSWSKQFSVLNPMSRVDASLLLDPVRQNNVLFGGRNPLGTALNETWTWANGQWSYLPLATAPSPRSGHRMVLDPVASVGLLFGGEDALGNARNDFWQWDGAAWSQLTPATLPPARSQHGFAYDERRQRTVLVGGINGATRIDDVWEWDGSSWTQITPPLINGFSWTPGACSGHGMAYDRRSEHIVLYGGERAGCQQDAWSWDGTEWFLHISNSNQPSARTGTALWLDPATNQLLLFGGGCGTTYTNELWELSLPAFARTNSYGTPCVGSNGPLALSVVGTSRPVIGETFQMQMSGIPLFSPCVGYIGFSNTQFSGVPLPLPLDFVRMYGCFAYMSADLTFPLPAPNNATNTTQWNLPIPLDPVFLARHIYLQGLALEFGGVRLATVTNGVDARIGDR